MKKHLTTLFLIILFIIFAAFITIIEKSKNVLDVVTPDKIIIDAVNGEKTICIENIDAFSLEPTEDFYNKYSKKLGGTINLNNTNASTCNKNYIRLMAGIQWTISLNINNTSTVLTKCVTGDVCWRSVIDDDNPVELHPVLYLTPNITLSGSGTSSDPYIIN